MTFFENWNSKPKTVAHHVIVITGTAQGIARELAFLFANLKAKVVMIDIDKELNEQTAMLINKTGGQAYAYVNDPRLGCPDIVICSAGIWVVKQLDEASDIEIKRTIDINLLGYFWTIRAFYPYILERGSGHIVAISSLASYFGNSYASAYCASKFGVRGLMESLQWEIQERGLSESIKLTTIHPFLTETNLLNPMRFSTDILPILQINETAQAIVDGVLHEKLDVFVPSYARYICIYLKSLTSSSIHVQATKTQLEKWNAIFRSAFNFHSDVQSYHCVHKLKVVKLISFRLKDKLQTCLRRNNDHQLSLSFVGVRAIRRLALQLLASGVAYCLCVIWRVMMMREWRTGVRMLNCCREEQQRAPSSVSLLFHSYVAADAPYGSALHSIIYQIDNDALEKV
ncbi:17-beta-hydroxysteroid dehydrogenase [Trichinella spiralis]|uniref:17-beta-hydroxysteroid dehydrogenase n=1 Tax=Trichinella spiralis TaxID=6334 RepID=A0ABR3K7N8_TRISP